MIRNRHIFAFFFISGFTALIFEVVWAKQACLIFGNTTLASAAVIAAFMTGLALGSYLFGKLADARPGNELLIYGILEGSIGLFALLFPYLVSALDPIYRGIYVSYHERFLLISAIRFALSFLVLVVPTALMGGTLPFLSRFLARHGGDIKESLSRLYAMNLFGATAGTFVSGFFMIAWWGLHTTSVIAAVLNLGVLTFILARVRRASFTVVAASPAVPESVPVSGEPIVLSASSRAFILGLLFVHGFMAFVVQICWTRTTALILGSSTYAFSAMLTTFLAGLGIGSFAVGRLIRRGVRFTPVNLGVLEMAAGTAVLLFIPVFEWMVYYFVRAFPFVQSSTLALFTLQFILSALGMIVPATVIGMVFPAALACLGDPKHMGSSVGRAYALNTAGAVIGAFTTAFFFISSIGIAGSLRMASVLALAAGFLLVVIYGRRTRVVKKAALIFIPAFLFVVYPWNRYVFSSGVFIYAPSWSKVASYGKSNFQKALAMTHAIIFYKDGMSSTVTVLQYGEPGSEEGSMASKSLRVNGKTDASTVGDMATQLYLGYIPLFAHPDPKDVLVIGLGSGVTLGTAAQFDTVKSIDVVEIEPAVVEANKYFTAENHNVLKDPRVKVIIGDGRNHIRFSPKEYDVIISEPSNPWISGVSSLFAKENYEEALNRLRPDGIFCQWFHSYQMSKDDFLMIMATFASVFPEMSLHRVGYSDYFLLGSRSELTYDYGQMMAHIRKNRIIASDLNHFTKYEENFLLGSYLLSGDDLRRALGEEKVRLNTDDRLILEYEAPKNLHRETSDEIRSWLMNVKRTSYVPRFRDRGEGEVFKNPGVWKVFSSNAEDALSAKNYDVALFYLKKAVEARLVRDPSLEFQLGLAFEGKNDFAQAIRHYARVMRLPDWQIRGQSGVRHAHLGKLIDESPIMQRDARLLNTMASLSFYMGQLPDALAQINQAINANPRYIKNYADMAVYLLAIGFIDDSRAILKKAVEMAPDDPAVVEAKRVFAAVVEKNDASSVPGPEGEAPPAKIDNALLKGLEYLHDKNFSAAEKMFEAYILSSGTEDPMVYFYLSQSEAGQNKKEEAEEHFALAMKSKALPRLTQLDERKKVE